ncbi:MAG: hypothetical protein AMJ64_04090 [Betaproteobacteria bacterium SG8_39]|nr:MAG: hypothetical protein AMJ64_04090 [Betaproteobacteria bacterium SG8_39]
MPELKSNYIGELRIEVTGSYLLGDAPLGRRRLDRLDRGRFKGPKVAAEIVTGGMDLLLGGSDGALRPDVRLILKLDDGETLLIQYRGVRHGPPEVMQRIAKGESVPPDAYYLRTALVFETASKQYDWMNRIVGVGVGRREPGAAVYEVFEVL